MRKKVSYDLEYREDGESKVAHFEIDFITNHCHRLFNEISVVMADVRAQWDELNDIWTNTAALEREKPEGYKDKIAMLRGRAREINLAISTHKDNEFLKKRFELISIILTDNGYKEELFHSFDFWDRQVDPNDMINFLIAVMYKDIDKKKVKA